MPSASAGAAVSATAGKNRYLGPASTVGNLSSAVKGTFANSDGIGTFSGTFTPQKFSVVGVVLQATGVLKGTLGHLLRAVTNLLNEILGALGR